MSDVTPEAWSAWLRSFRERFIAANKWTDKEAKRRIRDGWVAVRDGRVCDLTEGSQRPTDAVPVFFRLTHGGWKLPIRIEERLTGLVTKAMRSDRSPQDIVLGLLSQIERPDGKDESDEIKQKRHKAAFWGHQLLATCEDPALAGVIETDVFWQAVLYALQAGYHHAILELYRDPRLLADLIKAQAFQSGRKADELSRRLENSHRELHTKLGRAPKLREVAEAAGGKWSDTDACWQFGKRLITHDALCQRLKDIRP